MLRQQINAVKKKISDLEIFLSHAYLDFLNSMVSGVTRRYQRPVEIHLEQSGETVTAYTDGNTIGVNIEQKALQSITAKEKHRAIIAMVLHECGHILFTDFKFSKFVWNKLEKENMLYPMPENSEKYQKAAFWMLSNNAGKMLFPLYHFLDNSIEDGYVDNTIIEHIPGYGEARIWWKQELAKEIPSYETMKKEGKSNIDILLNMVLSYAKFGRVLYDSSSKNEEIIKRFYGIKLLIDKAIEEKNTVERKRMINEIFVQIFDVIQEEIEKHKNQQQGGNQNSSQNSSQGQNKSEKEQKGTESGDKQNNALNKPQNSSDGPSKEEMEKVLQTAISNMPSSLTQENEHKNMESLSSVQPQSMTNEKKESSGGKEAEENNKSDYGLGEIEHNAAKEKVAKNQEKEILEQGQKELKEVSRNANHSSIPSSFHRCQVGSNGLQGYNESHQYLDQIAKRLTKNIEKEIRERKIGDTLNGLYMGKRLDNGGLHRYDKKFFTKKIQPENVPDMEVCLLVDLSGSMNGPRIATARKTAYIVYEFCRNLNIPVSIYGHHTLGNTVEIKSFAEADSIDGKDCIRIFEMTASGCNRDGYALRYCLDKLEKSYAETKLMFVISDGRPNHNGYGMVEGKKDIQEAVAKAKKKGIFTVTAAIGKDSGSVRKIYTEGISEKKAASFLDISDLEKLPKTFPKIIREKLAS